MLQHPPSTPLPPAGTAAPHRTPSSAPPRSGLFLSTPPDANGWEQTMPLGWGLEKGRAGGRENDESFVGKNRSIKYLDVK